MKKQFFRVKQLADQTFLKADKSECLNQDELRKADAKVEYVQKVLQEICRKLPPPKRKNNEQSLATLLSDLANNDDVEREMLLQNIIKECSSVEQNLADELSTYEQSIDRYVSQPINGILEKEVPSINKQKKNLNKYILDKDSATSRYQSAAKNGTMKENLREDMDDADTKVDQNRDTLAIEMFGLLSKEHEICMHLLQFLKLQRSYHDSALQTLTSIIPSLEQKIGESHIKPVFGCDLIEHLNVTKRSIAFPIELCVLALMELGISEEGLFRVAGGIAKVKRFKLSMDSRCFTLPLIPEYRDVHVLASTLKLYLRELPEPLFTLSLYNEWMDTMKYPEDLKLTAVKEVLNKMPQQFHDNLGFLLQFLSQLTKHPENKMTASNLAIVMSPNLLWTKEDEMSLQMKDCTIKNVLIEWLIINANSVFPDDLLSMGTLRAVDLIGCENVSGKSVSYNHTEHDLSYVAESPRPTLRRKVKAPPPPMKNDDDSGSLTNYNTLPLARSNKNRQSDIPRPKPKSESEEETSRRSSLNMDDKDVAPPHLVNRNIQTGKVVPITKKEVKADKPIAAPRTSFIDLQRKDSMSKSGEEVETAQLRRTSREDLLEKPEKPEIPARPPSLRVPLPRSNQTDGAADPTVHKTQCLVYSTPHKLQPSIVTIAKTQPGHDNQIAEKEKFLGHTKPLENKFHDINSNHHNRPDVPSKPPIMKSTEKLSEPSEKINGNGNVSSKGGASHNRTRSDGNIMDLNVDCISAQSLLQTPPSPKGLNKPTQPPPPPPVKKQEPETTNF